MAAEDDLQLVAGGRERSSISRAISGSEVRKTMVPAMRRHGKADGEDLSEEARARRKRGPAEGAAARHQRQGQAQAAAMAAEE